MQIQIINKKTGEFSLNVFGKDFHQKIFDNQYNYAVINEKTFQELPSNNILKSYLEREGLKVSLCSDIPIGIIDIK